MSHDTDSPGRVVFVQESPECSDAAGLSRYELIEPRPFVNWSLLFTPPR